MLIVCQNRTGLRNLVSLNVSSELQSKLEELFTRLLITDDPKQWAMSHEPMSHEPAHWMPPIHWENDEPCRVSQWERQLFDAPSVTWIPGSWLIADLLLHMLVDCLLWFVQHGQKVSIRFIYLDGIIVTKEIHLKPVGPSVSVYNVVWYFVSVSSSA